MSALLASVNITAAVFEAFGERSGIDKRGVAHAVRLHPEGVAGDQVLDRKHHGGPDKAVYAYAMEDATWWAERIGAPIAPGRFGENLTTTGLDLSGAVIGARWQVGSALLEVAQPRIPCRVFARFWEHPDLVREFTQAARPGAYLRVIEPGEVRVGDAVRVVDEPTHGVTLALAFKARTGSRDLVPLLLEAPALPQTWHEWASRVIEGGDGSDA